MGWWDKALNGGEDPAPYQGRPISTPAPTTQWMPHPQYQPQVQRVAPWEQPPQDPVQRASQEVSGDILQFMQEEAGTWTYGQAGTGIEEVRADGSHIGHQTTASPMFLREMPDDMDPSMLSIHDKHEWLWQRVARSPLKGKSRALKAEPNRCPRCNDARYFERKMNSKNGMPPAPICMACGYTGESYEISTLN